KCCDSTQLRAAEGVTSLTRMQLAILVAVLAALASAQVTGAPVGHLGWRLFVIVGSTFLAPLAAIVGMQRLSITIASGDEAGEALARLERRVIGLWLLAVAMVLFVAQWPRIV